MSAPTDTWHPFSPNNEEKHDNTEDKAWLIALCGVERSPFFNPTEAIDLKLM